MPATGRSESAGPATKTRSWRFYLGASLIGYLGYLLLISTMPDIKRVFMYHGAEHMTIHAYEHGAPLTIDGIRPFPTAHPRCGTSFLITVMIIATVTFALVGISSR